MYDGPDWAGRAAGATVFYAGPTLGGKQRGGSDASAIALSKRAAERFGAAVKPEDVTLPPYYPRDPVLLRDWAAYLDSCRFTISRSAAYSIGSKRKESWTTPSSAS